MVKLHEWAQFLIGDIAKFDDCPNGLDEWLFPLLLIPVAIFTVCYWFDEEILPTLSWRFRPAILDED